MNQKIFNRISSQSYPTFKSNKLFSTTNVQFSPSEVRVRFAPSPTGSLHLGGLRTALYNYLFARQHNGKFILRIEDTDRTRIVPGSIEDIERSLDWIGLRQDEGPRVGGLHGPYLQSSRIELYTEKVNKLLDIGKAYKCFCSSTRLELLRKHQAKNREPPRYDGKCRHLTKEEISEKLEESGGRYVIRFALESEEVQFDDMIFGNMSNNIDPGVESDPVIMKTDGYPTYHFANVVDDYTMKISHVLRGSEWISSTSKHLLIYKAFGWAPPQFAHFPLITLGDGTKLSKRDNQTKVEHWRDSGYRPLALVNFLTNMGGGLPKDKQDSHEIWGIEELAREFNFNRVSRHPSSIDLNRLKIYNSEDLRNSWFKDKPGILQEFKVLLERNSIPTNLKDEELICIIDKFITRIDKLNDLISSDNAYIWGLKEPNWDKNRYLEEGWDLIGITKSILELIESASELRKEVIESGLKSIAERNNIKWQALFRFTRRLLTNNDKGLPVHEIISTLGRPRTVDYLKKGLLHTSQG